MTGANDFDEDMEYCRLDLGGGYSPGGTLREGSLSRCSANLAKDAA